MKNGFSCDSLSKLSIRALHFNNDMIIQDCDSAYKSHDTCRIASCDFVSATLLCYSCYLFLK